MPQDNSDNDTEHTDGDRLIDNTRRSLLGTVAAIGLGTGIAAGQPTGSGPENAPFAPDDHDHSGERGATDELGVEEPVSSIAVDELSATTVGATVYVPSLPSISGSGTASDPYTSPSGTAGMREAFQRLNELGGGVIYYPSGFYGDGTTSWEIDLANYGDIGNTNWAIYGDGLQSTRIRAGNDSGNGIRIWDSSGTAFFYIEIVGVRFEGETSGFQFVLGKEDTNAFNSCWTRFATGTGDGEGACKLNFLLNSYHYGVHNSGGGTACELWRCQFSGFEGSYSSGETAGDVAIDLVEYSFGNLFEYINVEATYDGIYINDRRAPGNVFQNAYFANVPGTAFTQDLPDVPEDGGGDYDPGTYFHNPFVAGAVGEIAEVTGGTVRVDGSTVPWPSEEVTVQTHRGEQSSGSFSSAEYVGYEPRSSPPPGEPGRTALADGNDWDPDSDGAAELVIWNGNDWLEIVDMQTQF